VLLASQAPARLFGECLREEENRGSVDQRQRDPGGGARRRLCALGGPRGARQPESHRASQSRGPSSPALHWLYAWLLRPLVPGAQCPARTQIALAASPVQLVMLVLAAFVAFAASAAWRHWLHWRRC
jgi:hypothetical protein